MAINNNNKNVTDKFGRTGIVETTISASSNAEDITLVVNNGSPNGTTTVIPIPDFWRASSVSATTLPTGLNSFTAKAQNLNDTTKFIQHNSDLFFGGANGILRAGQGAGNVATNTVFGHNALAGNTTGANIVAIGSSALQSNTTGNWNIAAGRGALSANTTGSFNASFGGNSLLSNTTASQNTAIGVQALAFNTTGGNNTALGFSALLSNTTATNNTAFGQQALKLNTTGASNTAVGSASLINQTTATGNTAIGYLSGQNITTGTFNTIIGSGDGGNDGTARGLTTGNGNIVIGSNGSTNLVGFPLRNVASATASRNTLIGGSSSDRLAGNENVIIGYGSGDIGNGTKNVLLGCYTFAPSTGNGWTSPSSVPTNNNTFIGSDHNLSIGNQIIIGDNNTSLGFNINQRIAGITNATAIGANTTSTKSNQISMGNSAVTEVLLSGKLAIDINALSAAADGTPIVIRTVGGVKTITI
jgi:hypothetical protein